MKMYSKFAVLMAMLALGAAPALAAGGATSHTASTPSKAKKYGKFCVGQSKKKPSGTKGKTDFSKCVSDMARLANGSATNPHAVCRNLPKKHVAGQTAKGTAYSECVSGAKKLLKQHSASTT